MKTAAVFVHGLWLNGAEFSLLRGRLSHLTQIVRNPKLLRTLMLMNGKFSCPHGR